MKVGVAEAKAKFAALVARAEAGEVVILTRKGTPIAMLGPLRDGRTPQINTPVGPAIVPQTPRIQAGLTLRDVTRAALDG